MAPVSFFHFHAKKTTSKFCYSEGMSVFSQMPIEI